MSSPDRGWALPTTADVSEAGGNQASRDVDDYRLMPPRGHVTVPVLRTLAEHCRSTGAGVVSTSDFPMAGLDGDELAAVLDGLPS